MPDNPKELVLTLGEQLLISRRRKGQTQAERAAASGVTVSVLAAWEHGKGQPTSHRPRPLQLTDSEECLIRRRRARKTQDDVANELGVCRWWINRMEAGGADCSDLLRLLREQAA